MIKIDIEKSVMECIENKHWTWFIDNYNSKLSIKDDKIMYRKYDNNNKKSIWIEIKNCEIRRLILYINKQNILKSLVVGKLNEYEISNNIIKYILLEFPKIFCKPILKSVGSYIKKKRSELKNINRDSNEEIQKIKNDIKLFFLSNQDILKYYIKDMDKIENKIESIIVTQSTIRNFSEKNFVEFIYDNNGLFEEVCEIFYILFDYNLFISENPNSKWGAYQLLKELRINTCPYCNRNYINTYVDNSGMCRADIDHFYPKSKYPFLAVSLYNFIPSCHTCNSSFNNDIDTLLIPHLYPYVDEFGEDIKFRTNILNSNEYVQCLLGNSDEFEIVIYNNNKYIEEKVNNSNNTFKLEKLYNFHKDYVKEVIKKTNIYNDAKVNELLQLFPELFKNEEEIFTAVYSNYLIKSKFNKRPLSKLTKDIMDEYKIKSK